MKMNYFSIFFATCLYLLIFPVKSFRFLPLHYIKKKKLSFQSIDFPFLCRNSLDDNFPVVRTVEPTTSGYTHESISRLVHALSDPLERNCTVIATKLRRLAAEYKQLPNPQEVNFHFLDPIIQHYSNVLIASKKEDRKISAFLHALGQWKYKWKKMNPTIRNLLLKMLNIQSASNPNEDEYTETIVALANMGIGWDNLDKETRMGFLSQLMELQIQFESYHNTMVILNYSKLGVNLKDIGLLDVKNAFIVIAKKMIDILISESIFEPGRHTSNLILGLSKLGLKKNDLDQNYFAKSLNIIQKYWIKMKKIERSMTINALGKLGVHWNELPIFVQNTIERTFCSELLKTNVMDPITLSSYLIGFKNMEYDWPERISVRQSIFNILLQYYSNIQSVPADSQAIANIIFSMGEAKVKWSTIPESTISALFTGMEYFSVGVNSFTGQGIVSIMKGLAKMNCTWNQLNSVQQRILQNAISTTNEPHQQSTLFPSIIELSTFIFNSGKVLFPWNDSIPLKELIYKRIAYLFGDLSLTQSPSQSTRSSSTKVFGDSYGLSNIVYGLGESSISWSSLPMSVKDAIFRGICHFSGNYTEGIPPTFNVREIVNLITGLRKMNCQWQEFSFSQQKQLENLFCQLFQSNQWTATNNNSNNHETFSTIALSGFLIGVSKIQFPWYEHPILQQLIFQKILYFYSPPPSFSSNHPNKTTNQEYRRSMKTTISPQQQQQQQLQNSRELVNILYAMKESNILWFSLPKIIQDALLGGISSISVELVTKQHISNLIYALGQMSCLNECLPKETENHLFFLMNMMMKDNQTKSQEFANFLYGLSKMEYSWEYLSKNESIHQNILNGLIKHLPFMNAQEYSNCMMSMTLMSFDISWSSDSKKKKKEEEILLKIFQLLFQKVIIILKESKEDPAQFPLNSIEFSQISNFLNYLQTLPESIQKEIIRKQNIPNLSNHQSFMKKQSSQTSNAQKNLFEFAFSLIKKLNQKMGSSVMIEEEFTGLFPHGNLDFPIDMIVRRGDEVIGFIEVDGDQHYHFLPDEIHQERPEGERNYQLKLKRNNQLKEYFYRHYYPNIPILRLAKSKNNQTLTNEEELEAFLSKILINQTDSSSSSSPSSSS